MTIFVCGQSAKKEINVIKHYYLSFAGQIAGHEFIWNTAEMFFNFMLHILYNEK